MKRALALLVLSPCLAHAEVPVVMTDIPPVQSIVAQVMGDLGQPGLFLDKGADEHDLSLRPSQMRDLEGAGLVVWVGPELTPGLASAIEAAGVPGLALLDDPATARQDYAEGGVNPHAWTDPANAAAWAGLVAERLATLDPEHAETYRANAKAAQTGIAQVQADLAARLLPVAQKPWIGAHDAYGYYAQAFGLAYLGGLAAGDEAPPGAARLAEVKALAEAGQIACAFPEREQEPGLLETLAPARIGPALDPAGALQDPGPDAWKATMTTLADGLVACLSE